MESNADTSYMNTDVLHITAISVDVDVHNYESLSFENGLEHSASNGTFTRLFKAIHQRKILAFVVTGIVIFIIASVTIPLGILYGTSPGRQQDTPGEGDTGSTYSPDITAAPTSNPLKNDKWSTWSEWGSCDKSCGNGSQTRTRVCGNGGLSTLSCIGEDLQAHMCSSWKCPDCNQSCDVGYLNNECDACICDSTVISGRVIADSTGYGIRDANIFAASAPTRLLTSTTSTGFFSLTTVCITSVLFVSREGFLNQTVEITKAKLTITMAFIARPHFLEVPQSKFRISDSNVTFCCLAKGRPDIMYYEWFKNGNVLDKAFYPGGTLLKLSYVTTDNNGLYSCRANGLGGSIMSKPAVLKVKDKSHDFCSDALKEKTIYLPADCVQPQRQAATYTIGECVAKRCAQNNSFQVDSCREELSRCTTGITEIKTVQCTGYSLDLFVVRSCMCASCSVGLVRLTGKVTSINDNTPVSFCEIWVNGDLKTYSSISGHYNVPVSRAVSEVVLTFVDAYVGHFLTTTKSIPITEEISGTIYVNIRMIRTGQPTEIWSRQDNMLPVSKSKENSFTRAQLLIPANSFYYVNGTKYDGRVNAYVNILDPSEKSDKNLIPGNFQYYDSEGEIRYLASLSVFSVSFEQPTKTIFTVNSVMTVLLPSDIANIECTDEIGIMKLNRYTGTWEGLRLKSETKNNNLTNGITVSVDSNEIIKGDWFNIGVIIRYEPCYLRIRTYIGGHLIEEMLNTDYFFEIEQYWVFNEIYANVWTFLSNPVENCVELVCNSIVGSLAVFHRTSTGHEKLHPGIKQSTSQSFLYEAFDDYLKINFSKSLPSPFFDDRYSCLEAGSNGTSLPFHYGQRSNEFTVNEVFTIAYPINEALSDRTWYPERTEGHRVCFVKIKVGFKLQSIMSTGDVVTLRVVSSGGTVTNLKNVIFGIRDRAIKDITNTSTLCVEYKCSGTISPFRGDHQIDLTNVTIKIKDPLGLQCSIVRQSPALIATNMVENTFSFSAPLTAKPEDGTYISVTDSHDIYQARQRTEKKCW